MERKAFIFNIQKYSIHDGPGVRTLIFFKGCPLRCQWCSNPESQLRQHQVIFKKNLCVNHGACVTVCPVNIHKMSADRIHTVDQSLECIGCRRCEEACPSNALAIMGESRTISELVSIIEEDRPFYESSEGGLTLGGGEALAQPEAAANLLMACKQKNINTAIETSGYASLDTIKLVAEFTDLFLFDVKHMDNAKHYEYTGVHNELILNNLKWLLENRYNVKVRIPTLQGINDDDENIAALAQFLNPYRDYKNFKGIDILPYHRLGTNKYEQLGRSYLIENNPSLTPDDLTRIEESFNHHGYEITILRH